MTGKQKAFIGVSHIEGTMKNAVRKSPGATQTQPLHWVLQSRERPGSGCNKTMLEIFCPAGFLLIAVAAVNELIPERTETATAMSQRKRLKRTLN